MLLVFAVASGLATQHRSIGRRLFTKADFLHVHAVSGAAFLTGGSAVLAKSVATQTIEPMPLIYAAAVVNIVAGVPMTRPRNRLGFMFGGGLALMCLWFSTCFEGYYSPLAPLWALVVLGSTAYWETTAKGDTALLYRLASWPNLTQLPLVWNLADDQWLPACVARFPNQDLLLYHYSLASAIAYSLSMFAETLRDRKLINLHQDLWILGLATIGPTLLVFLDAATLDSVTILPTDYWRLFDPFR